MANIKTGLNYYTVDTDRYQDRRIKRLKKILNAGALLCTTIFCVRFTEYKAVSLCGMQILPLTWLSTSGWKKTRCRKL